MLKNYFIVAPRNFWRNKVSSSINVLSLAIGISASLVIYLIVNYEFGFENFQKDKDRIYRVVLKADMSGRKISYAGSPAPMGAAIKNEVTGLEAVIPFRTWPDGMKVTIRPENNTRPTVFKQQKKIAFVDKSYFDLLRYEWIAGSPSSSLNNPYQVVLSESMASMYFPGQQAIGKEIYFNDSIRTTVTGVVKDLAHTDFTFNTFISRASLEKTSLQPYDWNDWNSVTLASQTFIKLSGGANVSQVSDQINHVYKKYRGKGPGDNVHITYLLQPLSDLHFSSGFDNFNQRVAHKPTLYGLLVIAAFLLILGSINFINLTTARATKRAKEIGVRKTMGSTRKQLLLQFLSETFFLTLIATLVSVAILPLLLFALNDFIPAGLHFSMLFQSHVILFLVALVFVISVFSGAYPAFVLSSFKPVLVLKSQVHAVAGNISLRKTLTVCQFVIAQVFIIATILVSKQISYTLNRDLGFKKDAIVYFHIPFSDADGKSNKKFELLNRLKAVPEVSMVSLSNNPPTSTRNRNSIMKYKDGEKEIESSVDVKYGDTAFTNLYGMKLLAGNYLPHSDTVNGLLINETYAHILGFQQPAQAIGKSIEWDNRKNPIVGVVADFHQKSFHKTIDPLVIASSDDEQIYFNIALRGNGIRKIENAWKEIYPEDDIEYAFLDETIAGFYKQERDISILLRWATGLSVLISYLGLIGLVMYITIQRRKEIGIRKIVGASAMQIIVLIVNEFLKLIAIASVIAIPIAWWAANSWLQNFAYRTDLSWWVFAGGVIIMLVFTLLMLGVQTLKAATANPVKSIRME